MPLSCARFSCVLSYEYTVFRCAFAWQYDTTAVCVQLTVLLRRPNAVSRVKSSIDATPKSHKTAIPSPTSEVNTGGKRAGFKRKAPCTPSQPADAAGEPVTKIWSINNILVAASIDNVNLFRLVSFVKERDLCRKVQTCSPFFLAD